jgi:hypothetical protein
MITIEQTVEIPDSRRLVIDVPPEVPAGRVILAFIPEPSKPAAAGTAGPPRFTAAQIEEAVKSPEIQALIGALEGADIPLDVTMKDIRETRLAEKYGE